MRQSKYVHLTFFVLTIGFLFVFPISMIWELPVFDINVHDTYFVVGLGGFCLIFASLLLFFSLLYYSIFKLIDYSLAGLRWLHVLFIISSIVFACILFFSSEGDDISSRYHTDSNVDLFSGVITQERLYLLSILSFLLAYITLFLNVILSFILRLRNNTKRS